MQTKKRKVSTCQLLHACTLFSAPIDIFVNGTKCLHSLNFGEISQCFEVTSKSLTVKVTSPLLEKVLWESSIQFPEGEQFTIVITENNQTPCLSLFRDDSLPVAGRTKLRMIQLSPDAESISIANEHQVLFSDVSFGEARFLTLSPDSSSLQVCFTSNDAKKYRISGVNFRLGESYTLFTVGNKQKKPNFQVLLLKSNKEAKGNCGEMN